jgi:hypothetical protein
MTESAALSLTSIITDREINGLIFLPKSMILGPVSQ